MFTAGSGWANAFSKIVQIAESIDVYCAPKRDGRGGERKPYDQRGSDKHGGGGEAMGLGKKSGPPWRATSVQLMYSLSARLQRLTF